MALSRGLSSAAGNRSARLIRFPLFIVARPTRPKLNTVLSDIACGTVSAASVVMRHGRSAALPASEQLCCELAALFSHPDPCGSVVSGPFDQRCSEQLVMCDP